jgi:hypothetical protein
VFRSYQVRLSASGGDAELDDEIAAEILRLDSRPLFPQRQIETPLLPRQSGVQSAMERAAITLALFELHSLCSPLSSRRRPRATNDPSGQRSGARGSQQLDADRVEIGDVSGDEFHQFGAGPSAALGIGQRLPRRCELCECRLGRPGQRRGVKTACAAPLPSSPEPQPRSGQNWAISAFSRAARLSDGRELARFVGPGARWRATRYLKRAVEALSNPLAPRPSF